MRRPPPPPPCHADDARCSPRSGFGPHTTLVPPPNGTTAADSDAHSASSAETSCEPAGQTTAWARPAAIAAHATRGRDRPCRGVQHALCGSSRTLLGQTMARTFDSARRERRSRAGARSPARPAGGVWSRARRCPRESPTPRRAGRRMLGSPQPHQRIAGGIWAARWPVSATNAIQNLACLVERRRPGAAKPKSRSAGRSTELWLSSSVTLVCRPSPGSVTSVSGSSARARTAFPRAAAPRPASAYDRRRDQAEIGKQACPFEGANQLGEGVAATSSKRRRAATSAAPPPPPPGVRTTDQLTQALSPARRSCGCDGRKERARP